MTPPLNDVQAQRAIEVLVACVRDGFTGSLEIHFQKGHPRTVKKTAELRLEESSDLMPQG